MLPGGINKLIFFSTCSLPKDLYTWISWRNGLEFLLSGWDMQILYLAGCHLLIMQLIICITLDMIICQGLKVHIYFLHWSVLPFLCSNTLTNAGTAICSPIPEYPITAAVSLHIFAGNALCADKTMIKSCSLLKHMIRIYREWKPLYGHLGIPSQYWSYPCCCCCSSRICLILPVKYHILWYGVLQRFRNKMILAILTAYPVINRKICRVHCGYA